MQKQISSKIVALTFGVLIISFVVAFYAVAWQEPTQAPPGGNVAAPLNVGPTGQSKEGGLILNTGGAVTGLIIDKGEVCIGTDCRTSWPTTGVITTYQMTATAYQEGGTYYAKTVSYDCPEGSNPVVISYNEVQVFLSNKQCKDRSQDACQHSTGGNRVTLTQLVKKSYRNVPFWECWEQSLESSCTPGTTSNTYTYKTECELPPESCRMEFQCGIKQTVGE